MSLAAVLYDIHGNLPALEAVLQDAEEAGVDRIILGGDLALFGGWPAETVARLRELPGLAASVRGNVDRWCAHPDQAGEDELLQDAIADCRRELETETLRWLDGLSEAHVEAGIRFTHASPHSDLESFLPSPGAEDEVMLAGATEARQVFGHTHLQFRRRGPMGVELINPGSVGLPLDGDPRAAYALMRDGELELRRVRYDHENAAAGVLERFGPADWAARSQRRLLAARP